MKLGSYFRRCLFLYLLSGILLAPVGCLPENESAQEQVPEQDSMALNLPALYSIVISITVHVAYEPGVEPFTGATPNNVQYWSVFENNMNALFQGRITEPEISVPKDLAEMEQFPAQDRTTWTAAQIMDLARDTWDLPQTPNNADFYVLFVRGNFMDQGGIDPHAIGIAIGGTSVVAVFQDVITASSSVPSHDPFIEQVTLVHELGHSLGLVNSGVPMVSEHEDPAHLHHCAYEDCVMYWEYERANLVEFIQEVITNGSEILFGEECLNDARSFDP